MAGNAAGEGEALEEPLHAILVACDVGVDFRVAAVQPVLRNHSVAAVAGAGEIDHVKVVALDDAIQVRVDEVLPRAGAPVADDGLLQVAFTQRALQKRVVEKIELAGGQIVCCAPVSVDLFELLGRQRRLFRQPCGAFLRRHGKLLLFLLIDEVSISFNFKKSIVRHRKRGKILKYVKISEALFYNLHELKR